MDNISQFVSVILSGDHIIVFFLRDYLLHGFYINIFCLLQFAAMGMQFGVIIKPIPMFIALLA